MKKFTTEDVKRLARACEKAARSLRDEDQGARGRDDRVAEDFERAEAALKHLTFADTPQRRASSAEAAQILSELFAELAADINGDLG